MRSIRILSVFAVMAFPAVATAQHAEHEDHGSGVASIVPLYNQFKGWIVASAEQVPEADYSFRPTAEVRSFAELFGHLANAAYLFCSGATGDSNPNTADFEKVTSKAQLQEALQNAFSYCDQAYEMPEERAMEQTSFFGQENTRLWVLNFNAVHNAEHYGNLVTYMRLKGMTPPSSQ